MRDLAVILFRTVGNLGTHPSSELVSFSDHAVGVQKNTFFFFFLIVQKQMIGALPKEDDTVCCYACSEDTR